MRSQRSYRPAAKSSPTIPEKVDFFDALPEYGVEFYTNKKSKTNSEVSLDMLNKVLPKLESLPAWTNDAIHDMLVSFAEELGVKNATLMWPLRIAVAGKLVTPGGAVEICHILGREETSSASRPVSPSWHDLRALPHALA